MELEVYYCFCDHENFKLDALIKKISAIVFSVLNTLMLSINSGSVNNH